MSTIDLKFYDKKCAAIHIYCETQHACQLYVLHLCSSK